MKYCLALMLFAVPSFANPYLRGAWDWGNGSSLPSPVIGACIDPIKGTPDSQCTTVGLVTHSPDDGYLVVPGEDYSLFSAGYKLTGVSKIRPIVGQSYNVLPFLVWGGSEMGLPITIPSINAKGVSLTGSLSPLWQVPLSKQEHGYFLLQVAGTLKFGK